MKKLLFILVILFSSCYWYSDYEPYKQSHKSTKVYEYYWYYNKDLFINVDSCYVVGALENNFNDEKYYINHKVPICNDTIYVIKKYIVEKNNIFNGVIYIKDKEPFRLITELQ